MESAAVPKRVSVGEVVNETFSTYGQNFGALIGGALAVFVVVGIVAGLLQSTDSVLLSLLGSVVQLAGYALFTGFVVRLVQDVRDGRRDQTVGDLFSAAMPAIVALAVFGILYGIGVGIGFLLLIVPGLILLTFWSLGAPSIVVEGLGPIEAFGRSWRLVRGDAWSVFGTLFVVFLIVLVINIVLMAIGAAIGLAGAIVGSIIAAAITAPIYALAVSIIYFERTGGFATAASPAQTEPPMPPSTPPPPPPAV